MSTKRSREDEDGLNGEKKSRTEAEQYAENSGEAGVKDVNAPMDIRVLISNFEAGIVIGKGGANVKSIREKTGCFISILKTDSGADTKERVMNVKGTVDQVAQAALYITQLWVEEGGREKKEGDAPPKTDGTANLKLLIHKFLAGAVIGKGGVIVREISSQTGCKVQLSSEPLGNSTEKTVTISGTPSSIHQAVHRALTQIRDNPLRPGCSVIPYVPGLSMAPSGPGGYPPPYRGAPQHHAAPPPPSPYAPPPQGQQYYDPYNQYGGYAAPPPQPPAYQQQQQREAPAPSGPALSSIPPDQLVTQKIAIPTACAGSVIGKGGSIINDIKQQSGCQVRIADAEPTNPGERVVTVTGTAAGIQTAVFLIRQRVENPSRQA